MLNRLQIKQLNAVRERLENPRDAGDFINTHHDISIGLFNNYLNSVGEFNFLENALKDVMKIEDMCDKNYTLMPDLIGFFDDNRLLIINWFEDYVEKMERESSIIEMADSIEFFLIDSREDDVTAHECGFVVYGNDKNHPRYKLIAETLSRWVAEKSAELLFEVANTLKDEPLIAPDYFISGFINFEENIDFVAMGLGISSYILEENPRDANAGIDISKFCKNALLYPDMDHARRVNGKIPELEYFTEEDAIKFYDNNRVEVLDWFNKYIHIDATALEHKDILGSVYSLIKSINLMPRNNDFASTNSVSIHSIADIIYADNKNHPYYNLVVNALTILVIEQLTISYQEFYDSDYYLDC